MQRVPPIASAVALRPVCDADETLIEVWIQRPEIQRWWGNAGTAFAEVRLALQSPSALCRMIMVETRPVGYAHACDAALWGDLPQGLPAGTWDVNLFIADPGARGQGAGQAALRLLVDEVFATTFAVAVSIIVSVRNEAAVRVYEKVGFRWVGIFEDPALGPTWMMLRHRA